MRMVGKINTDIFKCITEDITTDEVVLTDELIEHIKKHHPGHFEEIFSYFEKAIFSPDYILKKKKKNTGISETRWKNYLKNKQLLYKAE